MRERSGLTQEQVANHLNVTRGAVGHWERGKNQPPYDVLIKIAQLYQTSTAYLVGETDDPSPLPHAQKDTVRKAIPPPGWEKLTEAERRRVRRITKAVEEAVVADILREREGSDSQ